MKFSVRPWGFCSQFNNYLYAYAYAREHGSVLEIKDTSNCISEDVSLLSECFRMPPHVRYCDSISPDEDLFHRQHVLAFCRGLPYAKLRHYAGECLRWSPLMIEASTGFRNELHSGHFDLAVLLRSGDKITTNEMVHIPCSRYVSEIEHFGHAKGKEELSIFVMCDNGALMRQFAALCSPKWRIFSTCNDDLPPYDQTVFNNQPAAIKLRHLRRFCCELSVLQKLPAIVCTMSSNIPRFAMHTHEQQIGEIYVRTLDAGMEITHLVS